MEDENSIYMYKKMKRIEKLDILSVLVAFSLFGGVFRITVFSVITTLIIYASIMVAIFFIKGSFITRIDVIVLYLFYILPFSGIIIAAINCFVLGEKFTDFLPNITGRMINSCMFMCMYLLIRYVWQKGRMSITSILLFYCGGCIVLLLFGFWQLFHYYFGVPFLNISTRNYIHSIENIGLDYRITSLAEEPAYLIPYLIDLFIVVFYKGISPYLIRERSRKLLLLGIIIILFFTLSLSAYCNLILVVLSIFLLMPRSRKKFLFGFIITIISFLMLFFCGSIIFTVLGRLNLDDLLASSRLQEGYLPIAHMLTEASPLNLMFGYGPKGFDYMRQFVFYVTGWQTGKPIAVTSHVIFIDFFVEYGLIGLVLLVGLFYLLWYMATSVYRYGGGRIAQLLVANLFICCFYTADYASPRFTILVAIIVCLYIENKRRYFHENIRHNSNL